jgi:hypothetical protein
MLSFCAKLKIRNSGGEKAVLPRAKLMDQIVRRGMKPVCD